MENWLKRTEWIEPNNPTQDEWAARHLRRLGLTEKTWWDLKITRSPTALGQPDQRDNRAILESMEKAWKQKLIRDKKKKTHVTINVAITKRAKQAIDPKKRGVPMGQTIEELIQGETKRLQDAKARLSTAQDKHREAIALARRTTDFLYQKLEETTRELSLAQLGSSKELPAAREIYANRMEQIHRDLGLARLAKLIPRTPSGFLQVRPVHGSESPSTRHEQETPDNTGGQSVDATNPEIDMPADTADGYSPENTVSHVPTHQSEPPSFQQEPDRTNTGETKRIKVRPRRIYRKLRPYRPD